MKSRDRGIVTTAFGNLLYLELAVDLCLSVRRTSQLPVSLFTDDRGEKWIRQEYPGIFDSVHVLPDLHGIPSSLLKNPSRIKNFG